MKSPASSEWLPRREPKHLPPGDNLLPTAGHALAFIGEPEHPELVGPEVGHEELAGLNCAQRRVGNRR